MPRCPQHTSGCTGRSGTATSSGISPGPCTPWPWSPSPQASLRASRPSREVSPVATPSACVPCLAVTAGQRLLSCRAPAGGQQEAVTSLISREARLGRVVALARSHTALRGLPGPVLVPPSPGPQSRPAPDVLAHVAAPTERGLRGVEGPSCWEDGIGVASGCCHTHVCTQLALTQPTFPSSWPQPSSEPPLEPLQPPTNPLSTVKTCDYIAAPPQSRIISPF